jgi:hypothetical protein
MPTRDSQAFFAAFQSLKHLIDTHRARFSPLEKIDVRDQSARDLFLAHALFHGSTIRINEIFSESDPNCRQSCVSAAQAILHGGGVNIAEFSCVNPIMGTLWALACKTLIKEVERLRSTRGSWSSPYSSVQSMPHQYHYQAGPEEELLVSVRQGLSALTFFSANSALMSEFSALELRCIIRDWCMNVDANPKVEGTDTRNLNLQGFEESLTWPDSARSDMFHPASTPTSMALGKSFTWDLPNPHAFVPKFECHNTPPLPLNVLPVEGLDSGLKKFDVELY